MPTNLIKHISAEFGWLIFLPLWVLISLLVGTIGYKAFNPASEKELTEHKEKSWTKTEKVSEDGTKYVRFKYQDGIMEIPTEFISNSTAERSTFELIAYLPDLVSKKNRSLSQLDNHSLLVRILLRLNEETSSTTTLSTQETMVNLRDRGSLGEPFKDEDFPKFEIYNGPATLQYWVPEPKSVLSPTGQKMVFMCPVMLNVEKAFRRCETTLPWTKNLAMRYTLYLSQMDEIGTIHRRIIGFIKSLEQE